MCCLYCFMCLLGRVYLFRAENEDVCTTFVNTIRNEIKSVCEPTLWKEKEIAAAVTRMTGRRNEKG